MKWIEFAVYVEDAGHEAVCDALAAIGLEQVAIEESSQRVEAHLRDMAPYWDFADAAALAAKNGPCVKAYIADIAEKAALLEAARRAVAHLREQTAFAPLTVVETYVDEEDWANSWKQYYKPMKIGARLLVCPSWEANSEAQQADRTLLKLDPGMVFGTGAHHTTRMCLELLEPLKGACILDLGCGSGILAIASLLLGTKQAVCVDIDPVAERVVNENLLLNGLPKDRVQMYTGNVLKDTRLQHALGEAQYDIVVANIVADVVIGLCPLVRRVIRPDGHFVCSGIIDERVDEVERALEAAGFRVMQRRRTAEESMAGALETGWVALLALLG